LVSANKYIPVVATALLAALAALAVMAMVRHGKAAEAAAVDAAQLAERAAVDAAQKTPATEAANLAKGLARQVWFDLGAIVAAALGAAALVAGVFLRRRAFQDPAAPAEAPGLPRRSVAEPGSGFEWAWAAAVVPVSYLVLYATPEALTRAPLPVAMLSAAVAATALYLVLLRGLKDRMQYPACLSALAAVGLFFQLWEPPPPRPLPILKSLVATFPRQIGGWHGENVKLDAATEKILGADEYLNLQVRQDGADRVGRIFITYNANAMSNIPHVPWVCMTQVGFVLERSDRRSVVVPELGGREFDVNVLYFTPPAGGGAPALMLQYFNVGGTYLTTREAARWLGTTGSVGRHGSYLSQTQVTVWLQPDDKGDPMAKDGQVYLTALALLKQVAVNLETQYYPHPGRVEEVNP